MMDETAIPLENIGVQAIICLFIVTLAIFLMERRKNPANLVEDASSMYLCGETERLVVHNRAYRISVIKNRRIGNENMNRMIIYILLVLATMVVLVWISLPRL